MISQKEQWFNILSFVNEEYVIESDPLKQSDKQVERKDIEPERENTSLSGKRVAISVNAKKFFAIAVSACLIIAAILIGIIVPSLNKPTQPTKLKWGFESNGGAEPSESCAYMSETNTFDIDNVTLTFYFGADFSSDINQELELVRNIPEFDVYFADADRNPIYTIRHSTENFVSEEYRVTCVYDENYNFIEKIYNHSESITIPKELFTEEQGVIRFYVSGININEIQPTYKTIVSAYINYDIKDGKVILSPWDGHRS